MFAERGVENVALTQIVAASSQRNRSALHYHFGSREGVLTAVLSRRLVSINARRTLALEALAGGAGVAAILRATIAALGEAVVEEPWGRDYLSILAQVTFHPQLLGERGVAEEHRSGIRLARTRLAAALPGLSETLLRQRLGWDHRQRRLRHGPRHAQRAGAPTPARHGRAHRTTHRLRSRRTLGARPRRLNEREGTATPQQTPAGDDFQGVIGRTHRGL